MNYKNILYVAILGFFATPLTLLWAQTYEYQPLVGIPGLEGATDFDSYIDALYALSISLAALIAVVKIVIAGAKYMLSDIVTDKSSAKEDIRNSLIGLVIIIGAVIILNTINSDLTNINLFDRDDLVTIDDELQLRMGSDMQQWCDGVEEEGGACQDINCGSDSTWRYFEPMVNAQCVDLGVTDCSTRCDAVGGVYTSDGTNRCMDVDMTVLESNFIAFAQDVAIANSPTNINVVGMNCFVDDNTDTDYQCPSPGVAGEAAENIQITERCRAECVERAGDGYVGFDEDSRVCIMTPESIRPYTEPECNYYADKGWVWDVQTQTCMNSDEIEENIDNMGISLSQSAVAEIDPARTSYLASRGINISEIESAVFVPLEEIDSVDDFNQSSVVIGLNSQCDGEIVYDSAQIRLAEGYDDIGFYCLK